MDLQKTMDSIENELVKAKEKEDIINLDLKEKSKALKKYEQELKQLRKLYEEL